MRDIKVSLICTLKNEESSVKEFVDSLLAQSRPPDEIIMVDGGSTDRTVEFIDSFIKNGAPIKLIVMNGANIAKGRNIAIKNSKYDIIASTDAGCKIGEHWLKNLIKPFEEDAGVDVVSGWYQADARTKFEECVAELTYPKLEQVIKYSDQFLPSSRSVAYKKEAWEEVGGYPEWLYTAEDTLFDLNLRKAGRKFYFASDAIVFWQPRGNYRALWKQMSGYTQGEREARIFHKRYAYLILARYALGAVLLGLGFWHWPFWAVLAGGFFYFASRITIEHRRCAIRALGMTLFIEVARVSGWIGGR